MSDPGDFVGADFRLQSVTPIGLATIRARYRQDPKLVDLTASDDALNPDNYTLTGPSYNYVVSVSPVADDPQSVDLYLAAPLDLGNWDLAVAATVVSESNTSLLPPTSLNFTVTKTAVEAPLSGGAFNDSPVSVLRKHLNPTLQGEGWDKLIAAISAGDTINAENAQLALLQLYVSTASGKYLEKRAADYGYKKPKAIAMPDSLFRELVITSKSSKLTQEAVLNVLELFYGSEAVRATSTSAQNEPYGLEDGDDLRVVVDELVTVNVVFNRNEFGRIGVASAIEVSAAITRAFQAAGNEAYAVAIADQDTGAKRVRIYSGQPGLASSVRINGGRAQGALQFPEILFETSGSSPFAVWNIAISPNPGYLRFTETSGIYDLTKLVDGDLALIYGPEFAPINNQGTFAVANVSVSYVGPTLNQYFEILNPDGMVSGALNQLTFQSLMFQRPIKRTLYFQQRQVIVAQTGPEADIVVPSTTEAVLRGPLTGSYLYKNPNKAVTSISRAEGGVVTITFPSTHGLAVGDVVFIENVIPTMTLPAIVAGTPSDAYGT